MNALDQHMAMIQQALAPAAPTLAAAPPGLSTGAPLIPENNLQQIIGRALTSGGVPAGPGDRADTMIKLGSALMQPRMPGQSVAGNIGKALEGAVDYSNQRQTQRTNQAMAQAQIANNVASADTARQRSKMNMQILATQFPTEFQLLQQKLRQAMLAGKQDEVNYLRGMLLLENGGELLAKALRTEIDQASANLDFTRAKTGEQLAEGKYKEALASYYQSYRNDPNKLVKLGDETMADGTHVTIFGKGGQVQAIVTYPALSEQAAMKKAKEELMRESGSDGLINRLLGAGPSDEQVRQRAMQYMKPRQETKVLSGPAGATPAATSPAPKGGGEGKVGGKVDLKYGTSPNEIANDMQTTYTSLQKELAQATSAGDEHRVGIIKGNIAELESEAKRLKIPLTAQAQPQPAAAPAATQAPAAVEFTRNAQGKIVRSTPVPSPAPSAMGEVLSDVVEGGYTRLTPEAMLISGVKMNEPGAISESKRRVESSETENTALLRLLATKGHRRSKELLRAKTAGVTSSGKVQ